MAQCGGKNALDFQMSSYVGFLISKYPNEKINIVSNDKGFENLLSFWREQGFDNLELRKNIGLNLTDASPETVDNENIHTQKSTKTLANTLQEVLTVNSSALGLSKDQRTQIEKIVNSFKTKQAINNNLMKLFRDSDKVGKITKVIKPFLIKKK